MRKGSSTYCQWLGVELGNKDYRFLYIPEGFAHGFQTLEDDTTVFYQMSEFYHPELARGVKWDDPVFDIKWPLKNPILSEKDMSWIKFDRKKMSSTIKKILVTGTTGFIGNYVIKELLKSGNYYIIANSRSIEKAKQFEWYEKVEYISQDLGSPVENFYQVFRSPDLMIHLSWEGLPNYKDLFHFEENLFSQYFFIKNMVENGLKNIAIAGTCLEYGIQNGCLSEDFETRPTTAYGLAKDTLRKFLVELNKKLLFQYKWIRLFYMYGKGQKNSILSQLERALENNEKVFNMSGGEQLRDYLPVEKLAEYIVRISLQDRLEGVINCCSGKPVSIRRLVENYLERSGKDIQLNLGYYSYPDYEPMAFWGDDSKLKEILKT